MLRYRATETKRTNEGATGAAEVAPEVYYRFMVTEHLAFTPDVQFVFNPSLNPDKDFLVHFALRMRASL